MDLLSSVQFLFILLSSLLVLTAGFLSGVRSDDENWYYNANTILEDIHEAAHPSPDSPLLSSVH